MSIVAGLSAPLFALVAAQAVVLAGVSGVYRGQWPERPWTPALAVVIGAVTCSAVAFLTAAFTPSPEMAQVTTFPFMLALIGAPLWVMGRDPAAIDWTGPAIPGGALAHLVRAAWGEPQVMVVPAVAAALVMAAVAIALAVRLFRWEPRF